MSINAENLTSTSEQCEIEENNANNYEVSPFNEPFNELFNEPFKLEPFNEQILNATHFNNQLTHDKLVKTTKGKDSVLNAQTHDPHYGETGVLKNSPGMTTGGGMRIVPDMHHL